MTTIKIHDIERDPHTYLSRVEAGETFILVRDDRPVAEIKPIPRPLQKPRPYAIAAGEFKVPADFDDPLPHDILSEFEGS